MSPLLQLPCQPTDRHGGLAGTNLPPVRWQDFDRCDRKADSFPAGHRGAPAAVSADAEVDFLRLLAGHGCGTLCRESRGPVATTGPDCNGGKVWH
jgi:hypothetical protein